MVTVKQFKEWLSKVDDDYPITINNSEEFFLNPIIGSHVNINFYSEENEIEQLEDEIRQLESEVEQLDSEIDDLVDELKDKKDSLDSISTASSYIIDDINELLNLIFLTNGVVDNSFGHYNLTEVEKLLETLSEGDKNNFILKCSEILPSIRDEIDGINSEATL